MLKKDFEFIQSVDAILNCWDTQFGSDAFPNYPPTNEDLKQAQALLDRAKENVERFSSGKFSPIFRATIMNNHITFYSENIDGHKYMNWLNSNLYKTAVWGTIEQGILV
jgi:hypothetical protein